jgi:arylsulfatase A-like enzyme
MNRRRFLQIGSGSAAAMLLSEIHLAAAEKAKADRPNILWISCEDTSPDLGCYGDSYAVTPNLDALAAQGVRYTNVYTNAGVCAPSRSGVITGMYPTTIGTHHMRCQGVPPAEVKCFPEYLRAAGYYCANNVKTDYQFDPPLTAWDESSNKAHWRGRAKDQPFFAVINLTVSHESQNWPKKGEKLVHDPAKLALTLPNGAVVPPYYPDTPVVRENLARYYDNVTKMDGQAGQILQQLEEDDLAEDTIVWFWGDHGRGLPRAKRWIYDSGIRAPLIICVPEKWRKYARPGALDAVAPGTVNDELIAFIDFAPTMLSLAGVAIPKHLQGQAFLGSQKAKPRDYVFAARDRMDEAYDIIRAVRDKHFKYIRNYMPHLSRAQDIEYMNRMPIMQEMRRLNAQGKLAGAQKQYFEPTKPVEELYDTLADPHEVNNLADDPKYNDVLQRLRKVHGEWMKQTRDVGLIPEPEFDEMKRPGGRWQKTSMPKFVNAFRPGDRGSSVAITCATKGASIAYKVGDQGNWKLYRKPVLVQTGQTLFARACRIGLRDSNEAALKLLQGRTIEDSKEQDGPSDEIPHWTDTLYKTDLLARLRQIKALDLAGEKAIPQYLSALKDEYASVRYWAAIGLHYNCKDGPDRKQAEAALQKMLTDPAPVVRIAAGHALCDWGQEEKALPVLADALSCQTDKARLHAMIALREIGEKARPALEQIKAHEKDADEYVQRVTRAVLKGLGL